MPTKKNTAVKKVYTVKFPTDESDLVVETKSGTAYAELKTNTSLKSQLLEIKMSASEYSPKVGLLKARWYALETEINKIESLVPLIISRIYDDQSFIHLGIRRIKSGRWVIVGGIDRVEVSSPTGFNRMDSLSIEDMYFCADLIVELVERISGHVGVQHKIIDSAISQFDLKMSELGIDLSDHLNEEGK